MKKILLIMLFFLMLTPLFGFKKNIGGHTLLINEKGYVLKKSQLRPGMVVAINTPLKIHGFIRNSLLVIGNGAIITGRVNKNLIAVRANIRVKEHGMVLGNFISFGGRIVIERGASARCFNFSILANKIKYTPGFRLFLIYISFALLGLFFNFFFMPNFIFLGEYLKKRTALSLLMGACSLPLLALVSLLFMGTFIGFLFLPALLFIYIFLAFFAFYTIAMLAGERVVKLFTFRDHPYFELFLGTTVLFFMLLLPYIGCFLFLLFFLAGMGATIKLKFGVRS